MDTLNTEAILGVVTIVGGLVAIVLGIFQVVDTYLDIGDKLRKRQLRKTRRHQTQKDQ